ncbi:MAG: hypothetical protein WD768_07125 [Phycisphaeraceae bacterium]
MLAGYRLGSRRLDYDAPFLWSSPMITFHQQNEPDVGEPVLINCPACGAKDIASVPSESVDYVKIAYLIPITKLRATTIRCGQCNADIACIAPMAELAGLDAAGIDPLLRFHPTPAARNWSLLGLVTSVIPILGLIIASIAIYHSRGTRGWPASVNMLSIILAVTVTVCGVLLMVMPG